MSEEEPKPRDVISSWWFEGDQDLSEIDGCYDGDIAVMAGRGYGLVSLTAAPLGRQCLVSLHFRLLID